MAHLTIWMKMKVGGLATAWDLPGLGTALGDRPHGPDWTLKLVPQPGGSCMWSQWTIGNQGLCLGMAKLY